MNTMKSGVVEVADKYQRGDVARLNDVVVAVVNGAHEQYRDILHSVDTRGHRAGQTPTGVEEPRASAYLGVLVAEAFGVEDRRILGMAALANLCLNQFVHSVDDATDDIAKRSRSHVAHLMLAKAVRLYGDMVAEAEGFWAHWERYMHEASEAEVFMWRHKGAVVAYGDLDFMMMGRKSSLSKTNAALYATLNPARAAVLGEVERACDHTAVGVQLLDDLVDVAEDLANGDFTYPLVLGCGKDAKEADHATVMRAVASADVRSKVFDLARQHLGTGRDIFRGIGAGTTAAYIDDLRAGLESVSDHAGLDGDRCASVPDIAALVRKIIDPRLQH